MNTLTTNGIKISVETFYLPKESVPVRQKYTHAYRITIENKSADTVQLLRRQWFIIDSNGIKREVEGEGVIGKQPILTRGASHQYVSWCPLMTDVGKMSGNYLMKRLKDDSTFRVRVPEFQLIAPSKLN